jgi:hypothetical protein
MFFIKNEKLLVEMTLRYFGSAVWFGFEVGFVRRFGLTCELEAYWNRALLGFTWPFFAFAEARPAFATSIPPLPSFRYG